LGFHPHPKVAFESARPVGEQTLASYMDVTLVGRVDLAETVARLNAVKADGFEVLSVREVPLSSPSLMSQVTGAEYLFVVPGKALELEAAVAGLLVRDRVEVQRRMKTKRRRGRKMPPEYKMVNVRPNIGELSVEHSMSDGDTTVVSGRIVVSEGRLMRPSNLLKLLGVDPLQSRVIRTRTLFGPDVKGKSMGLETEEAVGVSISGWSNEIERIQTIQPC